MDNYMLPTDKAFVEEIAKAISLSRLHREADEFMKAVTGNIIQDERVISQIDEDFDNLWEAPDVDSNECRQSYMVDAQIAINKINLLLLTRTTL